MCRRFVGRLWGWLLVLCVAACGCNTETVQLPVYRAEGIVRLAGKPLANAQIVLHPHPMTDERQLPAQATTDASGKYVLSTYTSGDGAIAGEYVATVSKYEPIDRGNGLEPGPNILSRKFASPSSSPLKVKIEPTELNRIPELTVNK